MLSPGLPAGAPGNYAQPRLERVAHDHAHHAGVLARPVREPLTYLARAAGGCAFSVLVLEAGLAGLLPREEATRAPGGLGVHEAAEELHLGDRGAGRHCRAQVERVGFHTGTVAMTAT